MKGPVQGRPGHTTTVVTPWGRETYQVFLDEAPPVWVARIVTLPNRIWAKPGGREAVKFYGQTPEEAEAAAARFIDEERVATGRRLWHPATPIHTPRERVVNIATPEQGPQPSARLARRLLLRFGVERPDRPGLTGNLSETGLFIITDRPGPIGCEVRIDLRFPDVPIILGGEVVWVRQRREEGSLGCGVRLVQRPPEYLSHVRAL